MYGLLFVLPLTALYELTAGVNGAGGQLLAQGLIRGLLGWFGFVGAWMPAAALLATLLAWHRLRRDRWRTRWWVGPAMAGESLVLAVPLLVFGALFQPSPATTVASLGARLNAALGAGIYEELVFRLLLIGGLAWLLAEAFRVPRPAALWTAAALAAVLFSLCHFKPMGAEPFAWNSFWFLLAAAGYLSVVFVERGLGVATGCHVAYNLFLVWLRSGPAGAG